jgi:N-acyl-D-amino-acid deacylase
MLAASALWALWACGPRYDVVIRHGTIYDGSGGPGTIGDVALAGDTIVAVGGDLGAARGRVEIDATGLAVAPGFVSMLSWATESLIEAGRSQSDIRQGVTLEVFGEGWSMGPLTDSMKAEMVRQQGDIKFDVTWTTLGQYLEHLVERGIAPNVASFVGATTVRIHQLGYADRPPTAEELGRMQDLVREPWPRGRWAWARRSSMPRRSMPAPRSWSRWPGPRGSRAGATSHTCEARATGCCRACRS